MQVDQLARWLVSGLVRESSGVTPDLAFEHARLSFGQVATPLDGSEELARLFGELDASARRRFHEAIAASIDMEPEDKSSHEVVRGLIEVSILTGCNDAVLALARKVRVPSQDSRKTIYCLCHHLMVERNAPQGVSILADQIMRNNDYPNFLSMYLLIATARYQSNRLLEVAHDIRGRLQQSLANKREWPRGHERFRIDFVDALFRAEEARDLLQELIRDEFYGTLIIPTLEVISPGVVMPRLSPSLHRQFIIRASGLPKTILHALFRTQRVTVHESEEALA